MSAATSGTTLTIPRIAHPGYARFIGAKCREVRMPDDRKLCSLCIADGPLREWFEEHADYGDSALNSGASKAARCPTSELSALSPEYNRGKVHKLSSLFFLLSFTFGKRWTRPALARERGPLDVASPLLGRTHQQGRKAQRGQATHFCLPIPIEKREQTALGLQATFVIASSRFRQSRSRPR